MHTLTLDVNSISFEVPDILAKFSTKLRGAWNTRRTFSSAPDTNWNLPTGARHCMSYPWICGLEISCQVTCSDESHRKRWKCGPVRVVSLGNAGLFNRSLMFGDLFSWPKTRAFETTPNTTLILVCKWNISGLRSKVFSRGTMEGSDVITRFHLAPASGGIVAKIQAGILNNVAEAGSLITNVSTPIEC